jgi:malate dehydrogenase (oxaloacetate-decarboxylating)
VVETREELEARARKPAEDAMRLHPYYRGKVQVLPRCPVRDVSDFAIWYTPGVAAPCRAIQADPEAVYLHTAKGNRIAVVSDGTRVLGLGNIGPEAGLPVMEGKALLFKYLGGVDAVPICLATDDADEIVSIVLALQPSFGGINLEDIEQPKCLRVLEALRRSASIPVWHDDQQGTATVTLAAIINALALVGKEIDRVRVAMVGAGAANVATYRLLTAAGMDPRNVVVCDRGGVLHDGRSDIDPDTHPEKWRMCEETNGAGTVGGIAEALRNADVCIAYSTPGPGTIEPKWVAGMAHDAIVFACANPVPEVWPWDATDAGARIVATGRSDYPNQVNNSLGFPGIFRGVLDVRASTITDAMACAAARELALCAAEKGLRDDAILPTMAEWEVVPRVAAAVGMQAQADGVASLTMSREELLAAAGRAVREARDATAVLMREGVIPPPV